MPEGLETTPPEPDPSLHRAVTARAGSDSAKEVREVNPEQIGQCRIVREIGRGGMGVVYLGVREYDQFKRRVAIKVLKRGMDTEDILRRFELERQVLAALNHPNIARLYDGGETEAGLSYFIMEYVEGLPIDEYCDSHRLRIGERLELFRAVCSAVHCAHQNLIVHRDLKPGNILVTAEGVPKLLDFGIAKLINPELSLVGGDPTAPDVRVMTPEYASPEQVRGHPLTTASDVYSLGVLLYQLMTGHRPYRLRSRVRAEIERVVCEEDPERPSTAVSRVEEVEQEGSDEEVATTTTITPEIVGRAREVRPDRLRKRLAGDIDNIVLMAMRKEPQRRYASAEQFGDDIQRHRDGLPVIARHDTVGYRVTKFVRRHRAGVAAAVIIVGSLLAGVIGTTSGWRAEALQRDRAERMFQDVLALAHTFIFDFDDDIKNLDGSIDARELIVNTAMECLNKLMVEAADDTALMGEIAAAYKKVGDIQGGLRDPNRGNLDAALISYRQALSLRETLASRLPENPVLQRELATSRISVGDILRDNGNLAEAHREHLEAVRITELVAHDTAGRRALAGALQVLGDTSHRQGRDDEAGEHYQRSFDIWKALASESPEDPGAQSDWARAIARKAGQFNRIGKRDEAVSLFEQNLQIRKVLHEAYPDNGRWNRDVAMAQLLLGNLLVSMGRTTEAMEHLDESMATAGQRALDDPRNLRAQADLAYVHEGLGDAFAALGDWSQARIHGREAEAITLRISAENPAKTSYRHMVATTCERLGDVSKAIGDLPEAISRYRRAVTLLRELLLDDVGHARWRRTEARVLRKLGVALAGADILDEAREQLEEARSIYEQLHDSQPSYVRIKQGLEQTRRDLAGLPADDA